MLVIAAILAVFVYGMIAPMLGAILPEFSQRFGLSPRQNGNIALAQALGLIAASVFTGPLIDSEGTKAGLLLGLGLAGAALLSLPKAKAYGSIALCLFLLGMGGGCIVNGAFALAGSIPGNTARTFNLVTLFFGMGGMATPWIAANLFKKNSIHLCRFAGVVALAAFTFEADVRMPPARVGFRLADIGRVVQSGAFWLLAGMLFFYVSAECGVWNWMPRHLITQGIAGQQGAKHLEPGIRARHCCRPAGGSACAE